MKKLDDIELKIKLIILPDLIDILFFVDKNGIIKFISPSIEKNIRL